MHSSSWPHAQRPEWLSYQTAALSGEVDSLYTNTMQSDCATASLWDVGREGCVQ